MCLRKEAMRQISQSICFHLLAITSFPGLVLLLLSCTIAVAAVPSPEACVPIRWTGGPMEVAWHTRAKSRGVDAVVAEALARWYEPSTLSLLKGSPANCLLVTWSAPVGAAIESQQQQLVKTYVDAAHKRDLAVFGLVYAAGEASTIAAEAKAAGLDGLVLEGDFSPEFAAGLRRAGRSTLVIEVAKETAQLRSMPLPIVAIAGVAPSAHNLSEMGIRGAPSSEPWIESNIWLVRSFDVASRPVWISSQLENPSAIDYARAVADAAAAGGHWLISLEDVLRVKLRAGDVSAVETWQRISSYLKFAESHAAWRAIEPFGNVGMVLDPASKKQDVVDEYLKLAGRRQVPYRLLARSELNAAALAKFHAVVGAELDSPSATERKLLQDFAENGGLFITGPTWGGAPKTEPFADIPAGKGRVIVYKDPDPGMVARDVKELLSDDELGVVPFNVPSVITLASGGGPGRSLLVQLVNYFDHPVEAITLRVAGKFRSARLETPEGAPTDLPLRDADGRTEVTIPKLLLWAAVSLE